MRHLAPIAVPMFALIVLIAPAPAADVVLETRAGRTLSGRIVEIGPDAVVLLYRVEGGEGKIRLPFRELTPASVHVALRAATERDAAGERALLDAALGAGLFAEAREHLARLRFLGGEDAELDALGSAIDAAEATTGLAEARRLLAEGKWRTAEARALDIATRFAGRPEGAEARALRAEILARRGSAVSLPATIEETARQRETALRRRQAFGCIVAILEEARTREALGAARGYTGAELRMLREALGTVEQGLRLADEFAARPAPGDADIAPVAAELRRTAARIHTAIARIHLAKGAFPRAVEHAGTALLLDPEAAEAASVRARAELAAATADRP